MRRMSKLSGAHPALRLATARKLAHCVALLGSGLLALSAAAQPASAQSAGADKAMAEALFDRGLALMRQGDFEHACVQLEQSEAIERGIGTMLYLAECYEKLGRTASAWAMFREAASAARAENQLDRARAGIARAERLEPLLSKLTISAHDGRETPGLVIKRNGQVVPHAALGVPVPSDPGPQRIEASAPGRVPWSVTLALPPNGAGLAVDVPVLAVDSESARPSASATRATVGEPASQAHAPVSSVASVRAASETDTTPTWQRPVGLALGGAGLVAMGVGAFFGVRALDQNGDLEAACPRTTCATRHSHLQDDAETSADLSTAFWIGGAALLGAGAIVFFTAPTERVMAFGIRPHGLGAQLQISGQL